MRDYILTCQESAKELRRPLGTVQRLVRIVLAIVGELEAATETSLGWHCERTAGIFCAICPSSPQVL